MAKSDFTTSHVNDSLNQTESSSNTQQERSHSTVSGLNACVCMHACMHASVCVCVCACVHARAQTHMRKWQYIRKSATELINIYYFCRILSI